MLNGIATIGRKIPSAVYVLVVVGLAFAIVVPRFATPGNLLNLLRVAGILAIASYGQAIVIITGGLDFSIGSAVALTSVVTVLLVEPFGTPIAFACGAGAAAAVGVANGILVGWAKLPPFLATLGMLIFVHGLASLLVGGVPMEAPTGMGMTWLGKGVIGGSANPHHYRNTRLFRALRSSSENYNWSVLVFYWFEFARRVACGCASGCHIFSSLRCRRRICGCFRNRADVTSGIRPTISFPYLAF